MKKKSVYAISKYKCYKNKLTNIIKAAKRNYYLNKFEADIKQTWQLLKNINNNIMSNSKIKEIIIDNKIISDNHEMAHKFNEYVTNIGSTLAKNIPHVNGDHLQFIKTFSGDSMFIMPTDEFDNHINTICNKVSKDIGIICKILHLMPPSILIHLYFT